MRFCQIGFFTLILLCGLGSVTLGAAESVPASDADTTKRDAEWRDPVALTASGKPTSPEERIRLQTSRDNGRLLVRVSAPRGQMLQPVAVDAADAAGPAERTIALANAPLCAKPGEPVLPCVPVYLALRPGEEIAAVSMQVAGEEEVARGVRLAHGRRPLPLSGGDGEHKPVGPDPAIYGSDKVFPVSGHEVVYSGLKNGVPVVVLRLYPVRYRPQSGRVLSYSHIEVDIQIRQTPQRVRQRNGTRHAVRQMVDNPDMVSIGQEPGSSPDQQSGDADDGGAGVPLGGLCTDGDQFDYVVVTRRDWIQATTVPNLQDLLVHRRDLGKSATAVAIEDVVDRYNGADDAARLRNFIKDAYYSWGCGYILLGGDVDIVPMRKLFSSSNGTAPLGDGYTDIIPSDMYFQCLDGTMDHDGDGNYGEEHDGEAGGAIDFFAEIAIGRASAETAHELSHFIFKTIRYETLADPHLRRALIAGQYLGPNFGTGRLSYAMPYMEDIRLGSDAAGFVTTGFKGSTIQADTLYAYEQDWDGADLIRIINDNHYSMINHLGHGNYNFGLNLKNGDEQAMSNDRHFFATAQDCISGNFEKDCIAERLTTSTRAGAFAVVMNSRYGFGYHNDDEGDMDGPSQRLQRQFWNAVFAKNIPDYGYANMLSHEDNLWCLDMPCIRWCIIESNLFGDPASFIRGRSDDTKVLPHDVVVRDDDGNGDGLANPGETFDLDLVVINLGDQPCTNVRATLGVDGSQATIVEGTASYGSVPAMGLGHAAQPFRMRIAPSVPSDSSIALTLSIDSDQGSWTRTLPLEVYVTAPVSGLVRADAAPLPGAVVIYRTIDRTWHRGRVVTDAKGRFSFPGLLEAEVEILVEYPEALACAPVIQQVPADDDLLFDFTSATLTGIVTDAVSGDPIVDATVSIAGGVHTQIRTDNAGRYTWTQLLGRPTEVTVMAYKKHYEMTTPVTAALPDDVVIDFTLDFVDLIVRPSSLTCSLPPAKTTTCFIDIENLRIDPASYVIRTTLDSKAPGHPDRAVLAEEFTMPTGAVKQVCGLASDSSRVWVSADIWDKPHKPIIQIDPILGSITQNRIDITNHLAATSYGMQGMDLDDDMLWAANDSESYEAGGDNRFTWWGFDRSSGDLRHRFRSPGLAPQAITCGGNQTWLLDFNPAGSTKHWILCSMDTGDGSMHSWQAIPNPAGESDGSYYNFDRIEYVDGLIWTYATRRKLVSDKKAVVVGHALCAFDPVAGKWVRKIKDIDGLATGFCDGLTSFGNHLLVSITNHFQTLYLVELQASQPSWMQIASWYGSVPGGQTVRVPVTFDSQGLVAGIYTATIEVLSSDVDEPQVSIPVSLHVGETIERDLIMESVVGHLWDAIEPKDAVVNDPTDGAQMIQIDAGQTARLILGPEGTNN